MLDLLFFLLLGHYIGDFALQSDTMASRKGISKTTLTYHVFIYVLTIAVFLLIGLLMSGRGNMFLTWYSATVLVFIFAQHWVQDFVKGSWFNGTKQGLYLDQALHLIVLYALRLLVYDG